MGAINEMITVSNLSFKYGKKIVFSDISLSLETGKIYGLLGENGVGKTTLLKLICGLLSPADGNCNVMGFNPFHRLTSFLKDIYYIPEDFTPTENSVFAFAKSTGAFYPNYDEKIFIKRLEDFEVDGNQKFNKLSFGQQKKAIISFALSTNVKLLIMDEPSNGLDIPSKTQFRKVISEGCHENTCIVISTHQVRDLENLIDPIIILDNRGVLLNEPIEKISEKLHFSFDPIAKQEALYSESALGGFMNVGLNSDGVESKVNIETLFNASLKNKQLISNIFKTNNNE